MRRLKWAAIGGGAFVALLAAAAVAVYLLLPGIRGSEPENTARYFPGDTVIYIWATFSPGIGQGKRVLDLWNRFEELPKFEEEVDALLEDLEKETGIDFEEEVLPWVGPDLSLGLMNATEDSADVVAMIGVKDHDAASKFLRELLEYMEDGGEELQRVDDIQGFEVWADWDSDTALALARDWFLFASAEDALKDVLNLVSGEEGQSLADGESFQEARSAMNGDRAMSLYIDLEAAVDLFSDLPRSGADIFSDVTGVDLAPGADAVGDLNTPDWLAASVGFIDRGIVIDAVAPSGSEFFGGFALAEDPAKLLPEDTLLFGAASFEPDMDSWRAELERYTVADLLGPEAADEMTAMVSEDFEGRLDPGSTLAEALDLVIDAIDDSIDIDLEEDLFDHLGGQAAIAVRDFDFDRLEDVESYAIDVVVMLSYAPGGGEGLMRTVDKLVDMLEEASGEEFPARVTRDIGTDHGAVMFDLEDFAGETAYSPGYVLHGGQMTIGSTERALKAVVDAQNGLRAALDGAQEYRRARESLPDVVQFPDVPRPASHHRPAGPGLARRRPRLLRAAGQGAGRRRRHRLRGRRLLAGVVRVDPVPGIAVELLPIGCGLDTAITPIVTLDVGGQDET